MRDPMFEAVRAIYETNPGPPFSVRLGLQAHIVGASLVASRHGLTPGTTLPFHHAYGQCELRDERRCQCTGYLRWSIDPATGFGEQAPVLRRCCRAMTEEDMLCGACREWCKPPDANVYIAQGDGWKPVGRLAGPLELYEWKGIA